MIRAGIAGGTGYAAGELIRLLLTHPETEIAFVHSRSKGGDPITSVHRDLEGEISMQFSRDGRSEIDLLFLCLPHGESITYLEERDIPEEVRIIDLSRDFRTEYTGERSFVYGLPELQRDVIRKADHVANPGCFATAIELGLLPLVKEKLVNGEIQISAVTGSTGAGRTPRDTTHFSWRSGNISVYKPFTHQHLDEIQHNLKRLDPEYNGTLNFIPFRGGFTRGILAAMHLKSNLSENQAEALYAGYYDDHPFVHLAGSNPDVKQVVNTNKALLYLEKHGDNLMVISVIDNLLKGASGQAVQNMNLLCGLEETTGLQLKPAVY